MRRTAQSYTFPAHALVLRARPLGEKDRVLTLFCQEKGILSAVAKGARGPKSKLAALAQPFVCARFLLVKGRSLDIVSQAQIETVHGGIHGDLLKTAWASFGAELGAALPEGLPDARGFEILRVFWGALNAAPDETASEAAGLWFETQWLAHGGHAPAIGMCAMCGEKINAQISQKITFSYVLGGALCVDCTPRDPSRESVDVQTLRAWHRLERSRAVPLGLRGAPFSLGAAETGELGRIVRKSLIEHLGVRLRSQKLLEELRGAARLQALHVLDAPLNGDSA